MVAQATYDERVESISLDSDSTIGVYTGVPGLPGSAVPNGGQQYKAVKLTGVHQAGLCTAAADPMIGILQNKPQVPGQAATVGIRGVTLVLTGGSFSAGAALCPNASGQLVADTTTPPTGYRKLIAWGVSTGANQLVPALLI